MTAQPDESHDNPVGSVHGGFFATVLDSASGCAVHSTLPARVGYSTLEIKVSFLRPITAETCWAGEVRRIPACASYWPLVVLRLASRERFPSLSLCTDNGGMVAALGAQLVAAGAEPSGLDFATDSSQSVTNIVLEPRG